MIVFHYYYYYILLPPLFVGHSSIQSWGHLDQPFPFTSSPSHYWNSTRNLIINWNVVFVAQMAQTPLPSFQPEMYFVKIIYGNFVLPCNFSLYSFFANYDVLKTFPTLLIIGEIQLDRLKSTQQTRQGNNNWTECLCHHATKTSTSFGSMSFHFNIKIYLRIVIKLRCSRQHKVKGRQQTVIQHSSVCEDDSGVLHC